MNGRGNSRQTRAAWMVWPALAIITLLPAGQAALASAQDIAPDTPPELRDFKLAPDKQKPAPGPLPELDPVIDLPAVNPPPAVRRAEAPSAEPKPDVAAKPVAATKREQVEATAAKPANAVGSETAKAAGAASDAGDVTGGSVPNAAQVGPVVADPLPSAAPIVEGEEVATPAPANISPTWIWILAGLAGLAGLIVLAAAALLYRRRNRQSLLLEDTGLAAVPDAAPHELVMEPEPAPPPFAAAPRRLFPSNSSKRPLLEISFVPAKASISLANLSIKGQLRVINSGDGDADNLRLNAAIITASDRQNEMISAYFSGTAEPGNELGAVKIGERIALDLDLVIPISELQTFGFGEQKLLVPIILSRISYHWGNADSDDRGSDEAQFSCIIGRESTPPKPKMGALRLDLGPRSFAPLGQRPVFG